MAKQKAMDKALTTEKRPAARFLNRSLHSPSPPRSPIPVDTVFEKERQRNYRGRGEVGVDWSGFTTFFSWFPGEVWFTPVPIRSDRKGGSARFGSNGGPTPEESQNHIDHKSGSVYRYWTPGRVSPRYRPFTTRIRATMPGWTQRRKCGARRNIIITKRKFTPQKY